MRMVSRFEANLLQILSCLMHRAPLGSALPLLLSTERERPSCLSREAVALIRDALSKGCVLLLAREGGWHRLRHVRDGRVASGRLWERVPPGELGLEFSRHSLEFLLWLAATDFHKEPKPWPTFDSPPTLGDQLLLFFAYDRMRPTKVGAALKTQTPFVRNALCRLAYTDDFVDNPGDQDADLAPWLSGIGPSLVESLQPKLVANWIQMERRKGVISDWRWMQSLGQAQGRILDAYLDQIDRAGRRDLARFLLEVAIGLLRGRHAAADWVSSLVFTGRRLAERAETYEAALAFLRRLERLRTWDREARSVGYFDEGYADSQLWKVEWDAYQGDDLCDRALAIIREAQPLGLATGPQP